MMSETQNQRAARMAAEWWAKRLQQGDKEKFKESLAAATEAALNTNGHIFLECDYDPQGPLLDAVRAAGIECRGFMFSARGILPEKTLLEVWPHELRPKEGYANWTAKIAVSVSPCDCGAEG